MKPKQLAPKPKRFFDDWELTIGGDITGRAFLRVEMPHHPGQRTTQITGSAAEIERLANIMDKLLCELTGTKTNKVITDGPNRPPTGR